VGGEGKKVHSGGESGGPKEKASDCEFKIIRFGGRKFESLSELKN